MPLVHAMCRQAALGAALVWLLISPARAADPKTIDVVVGLGADAHNDIGIGYDVLEGVQILNLNFKISAERLSAGDQISKSEVVDNAGELLWKPQKIQTPATVHAYQAFGVLPNFDGTYGESHAAKFHGELKINGKGPGPGRPPTFDTYVNDIDIDVDALARHIGDNWPPVDPADVGLPNAADLAELEDKSEMGATDTAGLGLPETLTEATLPGVIPGDNASWKQLRVKINAKKKGRLSFSGQGTQVGIYRFQNNQQVKVDGEIEVTESGLNEVFALQAVKGFNLPVVIRATFKAQPDASQSTPGGASSSSTGPEGKHAADEVRVYPYNVKVNIDIARLEGNVVADPIEDSQGSITKVLNPNVFPDENFEFVNESISAKWGLKLVNLSVGNPLDGDIIRIRKAYPRGAENQGLARIYMDGRMIVGEASEKYDFENFDPRSKFQIDFIGGGIVDVELVVLRGNRVVGIDRVRATGIGCPPKSGAIVWINPASQAPAAPYDDFEKTASKDVVTALNFSTAKHNVVAAVATYPERNLIIRTEIAFAGLGLRWKLNDHPAWDVPVEYVVDYSKLPTINAGQLGLIVEVLGDRVNVGSWRFSQGRLNTPGLDQAGGAGMRARRRVELLICTSQFDNNEAPTCLGGGLYYSQGATANAKSIRLEDTDFLNNMAESGGGAALAEAVLAEITRCSFRFNRAANSNLTTPLVRGGGLYVVDGNGTLEIERSLFDFNAASDGTLFSDSNLQTPDIGAFGGGFCVMNGATSLYCTTTIFGGNQAISGTRRARGGAGCLRNCPREAFFQECRFGYERNLRPLGNRAVGVTRASGGALDLFTALAIAEKCKFLGNGAATTVDVPTNLGFPIDTRRHIPANTSYGGAVAAHHGTGGFLARIRATDCDFDRNGSLGVTPAAGGALAAVGEREAITGAASAFYDAGQQDLTMVRSKFLNNTCWVNGGAAGAASNLTKVTADGCTFTGNNAAKSNSTDADGGALCTQVHPARQTLVTNSNFASNTAVFSGGAAKHGGVNPDRYDPATTRFDAVYDNCTFNTNSAAEGGALRVTNLARVKLTKCIFTQNKALATVANTGGGGGASIENAALVSTDCNFVDNVCDVAGGGLRVKAEKIGRPYVDNFLNNPQGIDLTKALISGNNAQGQVGIGGAMSLEQRNAPAIAGGSPGTLRARLFDCLISDNIATYRLVVPKPIGSTVVNVGGISVFNDMDPPAPGLHLVIDGTPGAAVPPSMLSANAGVGLWCYNAGKQSDGIHAEVLHTVIDGQDYGVYSSHANLTIRRSKFTNLGATPAAPVDVLVNHIALPTLRREADQVVRIEQTLFDKHATATGVLARRAILATTDLDIRIQQSAFLGRAFAGNGVPTQSGVLNWNPGNTDIDARNNFWDHAGGPNDAAGRNPPGAFVSSGVRYLPFLPAAPAVVGP